MRIRFLGTGAATAAPLPFCRCAFCEELRAKHIFRRRASVLIDDGLLIDFGPDVPQMASELSIDLTEVDTVLQTHSHADHFDAGHFVTRIPGYAPQAMNELLLAGSPGTIAHIREKMMREEGDAADILNEQAAADMRMLVRAVPPNRCFYTCRYEILPVSVPHDISDGSVIYAIHSTADEKCVLYATDSPAFSEETLSALSRFRFDCVIMDHTFGTLPHVESRTHMDAHAFVDMAETLRARGLLKPGAPVYATHLSHEGHGSIARMEAFAQEHGYLLPEDGTDITL